MKYEIEYTNEFRKDVKRMKKRGYDMELMITAIEILQHDGKLPANYRSHKLVGKHIGKWECHITPDWLLVWKQYDQKLIMTMTNTGSHSDLFK